MGSCAVGTESVADWIVRAGWALAVAGSLQAYESSEAIARETQAGLWSGAFIAPAGWRDRNRRTRIVGAAGAPPSDRVVAPTASSGWGLESVGSAVSRKPRRRAAGRREPASGRAHAAGLRERIERCREMESIAAAKAERVLVDELGRSSEARALYYEDSEILPNQLVENRQDSCALVEADPGSACLDG